jgi:hypothetical protein
MGRSGSNGPDFHDMQDATEEAPGGDQPPSCLLYKDIWLAVPLTAELAGMAGGVSLLPLC